MNQQMAKEDASIETYAGLFLVCLATLMYEILLTRIFSVIMWYHFAFMAVSVAMFGMTVGAIIVYLFPGSFPDGRTHFHLAVSSWLFSLSILVCFIAEMWLPHFVSDIIRLASLSYGITLIPFIFGGICVSLVLTKFSRQLSKLYAFDLAGAACGCVLLIYLLKWTDGPTAIIALSAIVSVGSLLFIRRIHDVFRKIVMLTAILFFISTGIHIVLVKLGRPILRLSWAKKKLLAPALYERWNSFSRIQVLKDRNEDAPTGWGMSSTYVPTRSVKELNLHIDAGAGTVLTQYEGNPDEVEHLKYDVTNLAHYLRPNANVLVIGMGGGRDVLSALVFHQNSVIGVEINDQILEAVNDKFGDFTGHLERDPRVTLVNDEARSFIARQRRQFDIIQVSLVDTWAATAAGAFALTENSLYTIEAWKLFLKRLTPDGVLSFSRWYTQGGSPQLYRLTSLATAALNETGIQNAEDHILIVASIPRQQKQGLRGVATMLVSPRPFSAQDLATAESTANSLKFRILFSPNGSSDKNLIRIAHDQDRTGFNFDISPSTDNRPFFFSTLTSASFFNLLQSGSIRSDTSPVAVLSHLLVLSFVLTLLCIFLPLVLTIRRIEPKGMWSLLVFFAAIGTGFMMIEISQMQRLAIFLGHPTYSLSVVLFGLLLSSGAGSYLTGKITTPDIKRSGMICLLLLLTIVFLFGITTLPITKHFEESSTTVRILVAAMILVPMGFCLGTAFPLGMKLASLKLPAMTPWLWGVNGATSVWASILAVILAIIWGISTSFWTGFASYGFAFVAFSIAARRGSN